MSNLSIDINAERTPPCQSIVPHPNKSIDAFVVGS
jgi:hypothetical protein